MGDTKEDRIRRPTTERECELYRNGDYWFDAHYLPSAACHNKWSEDEWIHYIRCYGGWKG